MPSTAHRYEELAGGLQAQGQAIGIAATETFLAKARAEQQPAMIEGLRGSVRSLRAILACMRHDACGGRARKAELPTATEGVSSVRSGGS